MESHEAYLHAMWGIQPDPQEGKGEACVAWLRPGWAVRLRLVARRLSSDSELVEDSATASAPERSAV
ncbi:MAG: hypothetical protein ACLQBX_12660 [Candidatus Limnocylindrales bacterium]